MSDDALPGGLRARGVGEGLRGYEGEGNTGSLREHVAPAQGKSGDLVRYEFKIPEKARKALEAQGWDGESIIEADGAVLLDVGPASVRQDDPDTDIDAVFGPSEKGGNHGADE